MAVLAFIEDGTIEVFASRDSAAKKFAGIDVESCTVEFFEDDGTPLRAEFFSPNRRGKVFGPVGWVSSGQYTLVPNPGSSTQALALAIFKARVMEPNAFFPSMESLKLFLRSAGVVLDYTAQPKNEA